MTAAGFAEPLCSDVLPVRHGFFTRLGGVSTGKYASLNCSLSSRDAREAVLRNRAMAAYAVGAELSQLVGLYQVHGAEVVHVTTPWEPGAGPHADAMVTDRPGIALGIITADCAPVLLADPQAGIVGAAHAGWRGAVAGVIEATVAAMIDLGAQPERMSAAIGPCIRQPSYEVGADLRDAVMRQNPSSDRFFAPGRRDSRWQFDLAGYCASRLSGTGVNALQVLAADTAADETRFFSYRRTTLNGGGPTGHQISIITLAD